MIVDILIALAAMVVVLIAVVAMQPSEFRITRKAAINAPPSVIFAQVNDFRKWEAWSPWAKMDRTAKNTFEGAPAGAGAVFKWAGSNKVGEGCMTLVESRPSELIRIKLEFLKPFKATNTAEFTFHPEGNQTVVSWSMSGKNNFLCKGVGLFMNCDKMCGDQFERGLEAMKAVAEAGAETVMR
jgi:uncharacterized protein YndB with AHSA1/START domain